MTEVVFIVEADIEGGYRAKAIGHSIFTCADTIENLKTMVLDAVYCHFDKIPCLVKLRLPELEFKPTIEDSYAIMNTRQVLETLKKLL